MKTTKNTNLRGWKSARGRSRKAQSARRTGLYYYGARYYDPEIGRFISADPIVQARYDPQTLNRYTYCRNNPINYVDPSGYGWKSFWKKVWKAIKKPLIAAAVAAAVVFTWGAAASGWTIAGGMEALFSAAGATVVASSAATTGVLNTGEGRQFLRRLGTGVFDKVFGMNPKAAAIAGNIFGYMAINMSFQFGFARLFGANKAITDIQDVADGDKVTTQDLVKNSNGVNYGTRPKVDPVGGVKDASKILYSGEEAVGVTAEALNIGGKAQHIGVVMKDLSMHSDMAALVQDSFKALSQGYLTFGISHQAVNWSLINAGYNTTIIGLGGGPASIWSANISTFVYGPYGGGATGAVTYEKLENK